jgi:SAM-dependent methyltransferase
VRFETSHIDVETRFLTAALRPGARVLDAGCGRKSRLEAYRGRIVELVGVDLDADAGAENRALDRFVAADLGERLPFEDDSFDLVYANFVIEHLDSPAAALREWRRVLRPDGDLILLTSNSANPLMAGARVLPHAVRSFLKRIGPGVAERDVIPARYRANTPGRLESVVAESGFAPVEVAYVAGLHRYAERKPVVPQTLRGFERLLPARMRATIVAWYRPA